MLCTKLVSGDVEYAEDKPDLDVVDVDGPDIPGILMPNGREIAGRLLKRFMSV